MKALGLQNIRTILFMGAHCDDIEIGCGGTVLRVLDEQPDIVVRWVIWCSTLERRREAERSAALFLGERATTCVTFESFRDGFLPYVGGDVKESFERLKTQVEPDLIFTHHRGDLHQDHRLISELTWNTWRNQAILEYEIPKYDGDLGRPNVFVPLRPDQIERKIRSITEAYPSQARKQWFDDETFRGLARLRGVECNAPDRYAEAFYGRKLVLSP